MIRFTMPDPALALSEQIQLLRGQFDAFLQSPALLELFTLLRADRNTLGELYNGRKTADGSIRETQELEPTEVLNEKREALYPLLRELGFFDINRPLCTEHSHVLVLGGSLEACFERTRCAKAWLDPSTRFVDGLSCFRPIHPNERRKSTFSSRADTEFGAMSDSFTELFQLMKEACPVRLDVIGCTADERIVPPERYDPFQFLQSLIGLLDWIERFENTFAL